MTAESIPSTMKGKRERLHQLPLGSKSRQVAIEKLIEQWIKEGRKETIDIPQPNGSNGSTLKYWEPKNNE